MKQNKVDVVIIGAGAAGMMAALEVVLTGKSVAVIDAENRTGGRTHTIIDSRFEKPVELGAEFVHGDLPLTLQLFKKAGIRKYKTGGDVWQSKSGELKKQQEFITDYDALVEKMKALKQDVSVAEFMKQHLPGVGFEELRFTLKNYVQGYYAGDIDKASTYALYEELTGGEDVAYRVEGGYQTLVAYLENECRRKGVAFHLDEKVNEVKWTPSGVEVITSKGLHHSKKVLVTVSMGVLQAEAIRFTPALPEKMVAAKSLGFGHVVKINLQFTDAFWKDRSVTKGKNLNKMNFLFSEQSIPTWWTQHPHQEALLVGWLGGPPALHFRHHMEEEVVQNALQSLSIIFSIDISFLRKKLKGFCWRDWSADENYYGAYSYNVVNGDSFIKTLLEPVEATLYFAGEGLHPGNEIGTVEAALASGRDVAHQLIASFSL